MNNHMDQVRKRFVLSASLSVFVLLAVLLTIINGLNFTMAAADADEITARLESRRGILERPELPPDAGDAGQAADRVQAPESAEASGAPEFQGNMPFSSENMSPGVNVPPESTPENVQPESTPENVPTENMSESAFPGNKSVNNPMKRPRGPRMGPMGPDSPELAASTRYFTYAFDENGESERIIFALNAVDEEEAEDWANSLRFRQATGWTRTTYRYRVYSDGEREYVSVIDQGRELLPSLRILLISVIGGLFSVLISYFVLLSVSERLFKPLKDADRKQNRFISNVEKDFKVPLTILAADVEILEKENGESEQSQSMRRQIKKMTALVRNLFTLALFDQENLETADLNLSEFARAAVDGWREKYEAKGISLTAETEDDVMITGDGASIAAVLEELLDNALKFGKTFGNLSVKKREKRVEIRMDNDTDLPPQGMEEIFDRFTRLENAKDKPGAGLGLSHVREIVRAHNGRISARTADGVFSLRIRL